MIVLHATIYPPASSNFRLDCDMCHSKEKLFSFHQVLPFLDSHTPQEWALSVLFSHADKQISSSMWVLSSFSLLYA